jgi:hypothetical protein
MNTHQKRVPCARKNKGIGRREWKSSNPILTSSFSSSPNVVILISEGNKESGK